MLKVRLLLEISMGLHHLAAASRWSATLCMQVSEFFARQSSKLLNQAQQRLFR